MIATDASMIPIAAFIMLLWHDEQGVAYPLPEEALEQLQFLIRQLQQQLEAERQQLEAERQQLEAERQRTELLQQQTQAERQRAELAEQQKARLAEYVRSLGIDPDNLPEKS